MPTPIKPEYPIACLKLSPHITNPLKLARFGKEAPKTVADLLVLAQNRELHNFKGLGVIRIARIVAALETAGFPVYHPEPEQHDHDA